MQINDDTSMTPDSESASPLASGSDQVEGLQNLSDEGQQIVNEELKVLERVLRTAEARRSAAYAKTDGIDYNAELLSLRDQILEARTEDIPPLVEEMERLQRVAASRGKVAQGTVDPRCPYFGRLVLEENEKRREVLIGRSTFLDSKTGVRIVDWRDAPVSRIYYRYEEGDDYDEVLGDREVEGDVIVRRTLSIKKSELLGINAPQGRFQKLRGQWQAKASLGTALAGGQGAALRPESHHRIERGTLGIGDDSQREDKHLSEITALIDPRQFELISKPGSGLVVIQGGAGSGKTTIGLHRLAYLAFQDKHRFVPGRTLVLVFNRALVRYIARVLPALGVEGVKVETYDGWAARLRKHVLRDLPTAYRDDTPANVIRFKKHSQMLAMIESVAADISDALDADIKNALPNNALVQKTWVRRSRWAPMARIKDLNKALEEKDGALYRLAPHEKQRLNRALEPHHEKLSDLSQIWYDLLTHDARIDRYFGEGSPTKGEFSERELTAAISYCARNCAVALAYQDEKREPAQEYSDYDKGIDGSAERDTAALDQEDAAIFLRLYQKLIGPIKNKRGKFINYEHMFIDETQDLSPVELAVALAMTTRQRSITLAGDVAQRLHMDNGFTSWEAVLAQLDLAHTAIEPLELSYRSTQEIIEFSTAVLGPLKNDVAPIAIRRGAPVEGFGFEGQGPAVSFLSEALRNLVRAEPLASVCVVARYPEQAQTYFDGLRQGEVPNLRHVADQDFSFRPGVDVTDITQVKGLEFDYVILVDVNAASYPKEDEARHLLHIGATRAAHQLWVITSSTPSQILPDSVRAQI